MELKQGSSIRLPIRLVQGTSGAGVTGVTTPTIYVKKSGASPNQKAVANGVSWFEVDATHYPGLYDVLLDSSDTNTPGPMVISAQGGGSDICLAMVDVMSSTNADLATAIGTVGTKVDAANSSLESVALGVSNVSSAVAGVANSVTSLRNLVDWIRKLMRNRSRTDTTAKTYTVFNDDGITPLITYACKDGSGVSSTSDIKELTPQGSWVAP